MAREHKFYLVAELLSAGVVLKEYGTKAELADALKEMIAGETLIRICVFQGERLHLSKGRNKYLLGGQDLVDYGEDSGPIYRDSSPIPLFDLPEVTNLEADPSIDFIFTESTTDDDDEEEDPPVILKMPISKDIRFADTGSDNQENGQDQTRGTRHVEED